MNVMSSNSIDTAKEVNDFFAVVSGKDAIHNYIWSMFLFVIVLPLIIPPFTPFCFQSGLFLWDSCLFCTSFWKFSSISDTSSPYNFRKVNNVHGTVVLQIFIWRRYSVKQVFERYRYNVLNCETQGSRLPTPMYFAMNDKLAKN